MLLLAFLLVWFGLGLLNGGSAWLGRLFPISSSKLDTCARVLPVGAAGLAITAASAAILGTMVEYTEADPKPEIEQACKVDCIKELAVYKACAERIKTDTSGTAHCTGQYFDFWKCVDKCAAPKLFAVLK